jgi:hypothetical protein
MKKHIAIIISVLCGIALYAQQKIQFYSNDIVVFEEATSNVDSIKFGSGNVVVNTPSSALPFSISGIDSVLFLKDLSSEVADSIIRIHYAGSAVEIQNPYENSGLTITTDGSNVVVDASTGIKDLEYYISGFTENGSLSINSDSRLTLVLDEVTIFSQSSLPVIQIVQDKAVTIKLIGTSSLADNSLNTSKGAIMSKTQLLFSPESNGQLNVAGNSKHAIFSSDYVLIEDGNTINITTSKADAIHVDYFVMNGGKLIANNVEGDGVDAEKSRIEINAGEIEISVVGDDKKGLKCDSAILISGGILVLNMSGAGAKAIKCGAEPLQISGGTIELNITSADPYYDETEFDYSYGGAMKSDASINISGGEITINSSANGAKAINGASVNISGGAKVFANLVGSTFNEPKGSGYDPSFLCGVKSDGDVLLKDAKLEINLSAGAIGAKGINSDANITMEGGYLVIDAKGSFCIYKDSTGVSDTTATIYLKADKDVVLRSGNITMTGNGRGINSLNAYIGTEGAENESLVMDITCNGTQSVTTSNSSSMGGMFGGGGMGNESRTKYISKPRGFNVDNIIDIYSGTITINSGDAPIFSNNQVNISGGHIIAEVLDGMDAKGVRADSILTISGGLVSVKEAFEGFEACYINLLGGTTMVNTSDDGWNATASHLSSSSSSSSMGGEMWGGFSNGGTTPVLTISGGHHILVAGGDGFDSNGNGVISGGTVVLAQSGNGNGIFDIGDGNYTLSVSGGTLLGFGGSDMRVDPTVSGQVVATGYKSANLSVNTLLHVADGNGNVLSSIVLPISSSAMYFASDKSNSSYGFYTGGNYNGSYTYFGELGYNNGSHFYGEGGTVSGASSSGSSMSSGGRW